MFNLQKIIKNPLEYFFRLGYLIYLYLQYPFYKIMFKKFKKLSFIHPLASLRNHANIEIGNSVIINRNVNIWVRSLLLGDNVVINPNTCIYGDVKIGNNVMIAPNCMIASGNHGIKNNGVPMIEQSCNTKGSIVIEEDVWIGSNCVILDGVKIGKGAVIGGGECSC